jgi:hypothetical protein
VRRLVLGPHPGEKLVQEHPRACGRRAVDEDPVERALPALRAELGERPVGRRERVGGDVLDAQRVEHRVGELRVEISQRHVGRCAEAVAPAGHRAHDRDQPPVAAGAWRRTKSRLPWKMAGASLSRVATW